MIKPKKLDKKSMCCVAAMLLFLIICSSCITVQAAEPTIAAVDMVGITKTDGSGGFVIENVKEGTAIISITAGTKETIIQTEITENAEMIVDLYQNSILILPAGNELDQEEQISGIVCYRNIPLEGVSIKLYQERSAAAAASGVTYESIGNNAEKAVQQESDLNPVNLALTPANQTDMINTDTSTEKQGALKVTVTNADNEVLENAIIAIYDKATKSHILKNAVAYVNTAESGYAYFPELEAGEYVVKEMTAPTGYDVNGEAYPVEIRAGQEAKFTILHTVAGSTDDTQEDEKEGTGSAEEEKDATGASSEPKSETLATGTTTEQNKPVSAETSPQTSDPIMGLQKTMMMNMYMMMLLAAMMIAIAIMFLVRQKAK